MTEEEKPRQLPERFRASADPKDPGYAILQANDTRQAELAAKVHSPFGGATPREMFRAKAHIRIETLSNPALILTDGQKESLAEAWATLGRYDLASELSLVHSEMYAQYQNTVSQDGGQWCEHPSQHRVLSEWIWSVREGKEVALYRCNVCQRMEL